MPSRKVIVSVLGIFIALSVVALIPVFTYGFTVNVAEIETNIGLSSGLSTSSSQEPSFSLESFNVVANEKAISSYEYIFSKLGGNMETEEERNGGTTVVDIVISLDLTTPTNHLLSFSFNPQGLKGEGLKKIMILVGPDELNGEVGTFQLTITISVTVSLSGVELLNLDLTPVDLTFEMPV